MASKLQHSILLSKDIDLKALLGVNIDDEESLLISCKSFVKRFSLSDRKQVNSWITSSWHPFSTNVVRDQKSGKICGVINKTCLCQWDNEETNIEGVKKILFKSSINTFLLHENDIYILFDCGFLESLDSALKTRKYMKEQLINENATILTAIILKDAAVMLTENEAEIRLCKFYFGENMRFSSLIIVNSAHHLVGSCISSSGKLLTIWSDGNLYSKDITDSELSSSPGAFQGTLRFFHCQKRIKMLEFSYDHIILHGMRSNEDGGLIVLWDCKFGVDVSSKPLKMYSDPPLSWSVNSGIVVGDGRTLAYIPVMLKPSTVASMFASRIGDSVNQYCECTYWTEPLDRSLSGVCTVALPSDANPTIYSSKSTELFEVIKQVRPGNVSENIMVDDVVSHLIEKKNLDLLNSCFSEFKIIPERTLVRALKYFLETPNENFKSAVKKRNTSKRKNEGNNKRGNTNNCIENNKEIAKEKEAVDLRLCRPSSFDETDRDRRIQVLNSEFDPGKEKVINSALRHPFSEKQLSQSLYLLGFDTSWALMRYLHHLLASGKAHMLLDGSDTVPSIDKTSQWLSLLIDSNYHHLVLTSEVDIHKRLLVCLQDASNLLAFLEASSCIEPLIERVMEPQDAPLDTHSDSPYSIERILVT